MNTTATPPHPASPAAAPQASPPASALAAFDPRAISRPDSRLLTYYIIVSLFTLLGFPFTFIPLYCRYITLRYRFDDEGVWMSWGLLWRREVSLTYRRIQDIHLTRNLLQRWMGLATVSIQTASGSATPEMTIEGILEAEPLRDWLYTKMRGARGLDHPPAGPDANADPAATAPADEVLSLLIQIRDSLAALTPSPPPPQEPRA